MENKKALQINNHKLKKTFECGGKYKGMANYIKFEVIITFKLKNYLVVIGVLNS